MIKLKKNVKRQIVNTVQKKKSEKPLDSKFLGKTDQKFDRETVAKKIGSFNVGGSGSSKIAKKTTKRNKAPKKPKIELSDLSIQTDRIIRQVNQEEKRETLRSQLGEKTIILKGEGLSQSNDFVEDLPLSDLSRLNTVEYKFFGFYDRIRKKLEQFWGASLREKANNFNRAGRGFPAFSDKITSLRVTIDNLGNIVRVYLKTSSGVKELDDAAIESFNQAGPFPNPPREMVESGTANIEWGFVVKS